MSTFALLSDAFSKYQLVIPPDICLHVNYFLQKEAHICCSHCYLNLLEVSVTKPFIRRIPKYYKVNYGRVFTSDGMLTEFDTNNVDIEIASSEGTLIVQTTPDVLSICGITLKNEVIRYEETNWYKCLYSESKHDFVYLCAHCFLFTRNKLKRIFRQWKELSLKVGS